MNAPRIAILLPWLAGPLTWAAHFVLVYAANGVFCARPAWHGLWADAGLSAWVLSVAAVLAIAVIALVYWRQRARWPRTDDAGFFPRVAGALSLLAILAIVWQTLPVWWVPACQSG